MRREWACKVRPIFLFFLLLLTLPQAKQPHHLSVAWTWDRGAILPTSTTSTTSLARTRDGGALLPTTTTTMTPPSLERKTEGLYCPPQPQPLLWPLPCSNARRRGAIAHNHNHNPNPNPSLARTWDVGALIAHHHHHNDNHDLSLAWTQLSLKHCSNTRREGLSRHPQPLCLSPPPLSLKTRAGGVFYLHYLVTLYVIYKIIIMWNRK